MKDLKSSTNLLFLRDEELRWSMAHLFAAHRDLMASADSVLTENGLGRAHLRALFYIVRHPGLTVGELLQHLGITKQSLSRILQDLTQQAFVVQRQGQKDRRQRHLDPTDKGVKLDQDLTSLQRRHLAEAFRAAGPQAVDGFRTVLQHLTKKEP